MGGGPWQATVVSDSQKVRYDCTTHMHVLLECVIRGLCALPSAGAPLEVPPRVGYQC